MGDLVGSVGNLLGGTTQNADFSATGAPMDIAANTIQTEQAYGDSQRALQQQQALVNALNAQNGIQNQSDVFNQQQQLANALQQQMMGQGPNPAQAQLQQNTAANTANQAALMAGQRGAGSNVGMMARQAGQQGGAIQQQAVGQAATMQAQQQLSAQGQLQNQQNMMGGLSSNQVANQMQGTSDLNRYYQNEQQMLLNQVQAQNMTAAGMQGNMNSSNQAMAATNANNSAKFVSGLINSGASAAGGGMPMGYSGGLVKPGEIDDGTYSGHDNPKLAKVPMKDRFYDGGEVESQKKLDMVGSINDFVKKRRASNEEEEPKRYAQGGEVPDHIRGLGSIYHDGFFQGGMSYEGGGTVPGEANVQGDSPKNDVVEAVLSPGEIVIPRSIVMGKDPVGASAKFVAALIEKNGHPKDDVNDFKSALKKAISSRKK